MLRSLQQNTRRRDAVRLIAELQPAVLAAQAGEAVPPDAEPAAAGPSGETPPVVPPPLAA